MSQAAHAGASVGWGDMSPAPAPVGISGFLAPNGYGGGGQLDPAALAAAYAHLQANPVLLHALVNSASGTGANRRFRTPQPDRSGIKKCGHCQCMKSCVEFSADTSRGDGLRGWCKLCEAEARSTRYKKRKAAATAAAADRRSLEQPLGGMFWPAGSGASSGWSGGGAPALPPNVDPAAMQQAMLWHLQQLAQQQQQKGISGSPSHGSAFHTVKQRGRRCSSASGSEGDTPVTSDSENSALDRYKKRRGQDADPVWQPRNSGGSTPLAPPAPLRKSPPGDDFTALVGFARPRSLAHHLPPGAPLPPTEVHVPKRSRTRCPPQEQQTAPFGVDVRPHGDMKPVAISNAEAAASLSVAPAKPPPPATPAQRKERKELADWASTMMAGLLLMRASAHVRQPSAQPAAEQPPAAALAAAAPHTAEVAAELAQGVEDESKVAPQPHN